MAERVSVNKLALEELKQYADSQRRIVDAEFNFQPKMALESLREFRVLLHALDEQDA